MMKNSFHAVWCIGAIIAAAAPKAAAVTTVVTNDAFDLAAAFAPIPDDATITGNFVEFSNSSQSGTFTDGDGSIGITSGIILSTGDVTGIGIGAASPLSSAFGGTPSLSTTALLDQIPNFTSTYSDAARLSLTINPGLVSAFVNFSFAYLTSEISPSDQFGIFVDGIYMGDLAGSAIDQGHPWLNASVPNLGFDQALYENGNPLSSLFFTISLQVPSPGSTFEVDFVLADGFNDQIDTAIFLGNFSSSTTALGTVAVPEVSTSLLISLAGFAWIGRRRRC